MDCRKLSTDGAAQTVDGILFHGVMVDGRNENLYTSTRIQLAPDVGRGQNVGHRKCWVFFLYGLFKQLNFD